MARFVALYRGINVGGRNSVAMEALRAMHERLGHCEVASHVQSGNIVFSAAGSAAALARACAARLERDFGMAARVFVVTAQRWAALVRENPYPEFGARNPAVVHVGVCDGTPSRAGLEALREKTGGPETFVTGSGVIYLHAPDGIGRSKFAAGMEKACGVPVTMRNWRTVEALAAMLEKENRRVAGSRSSAARGRPPPRRRGAPSHSSPAPPK